MVLVLMLGLVMVMVVMVVAIVVVVMVAFVLLFAFLFVFLVLFLLCLFAVIVVVYCRCCCFLVTIHHRPHTVFFLSVRLGRGACSRHRRGRLPNQPPTAPRLGFLRVHPVYFSSIYSANNPHVGQITIYIIWMPACCYDVLCKFYI